MVNNGGYELDEPTLPQPQASGSNTRSHRSEYESSSSHNSSEAHASAYITSTLPGKSEKASFSGTQEHVQDEEVHPRLRSGAYLPPHVPSLSAECGQHDNVPSPSSTTPYPTASARHLDSESTFNGDLDFLEACIHQRLHTFTFSAALSFVRSPTQVDEYEHADIEDSNDRNTGPYALPAQAPENSEFLEQENWLSMMYATVSTIKTSSLSLEDGERCSKLLAALREEWGRMQIHKEREWLRQKDVVDSCAQTRTPFVDSRMFFVTIQLVSMIDTQNMQAAIS